MSSSPTDGAAAAQLVAVTMPQMGVSVAEGTIVEWRKQPGDPVSADEPICEVTTDKIDVEIPAPVDGVLVRHLADVDETVAVGTPIAEIDTAAGEAGRAPHRASPPVPMSASPGATASPPDSESRSADLTPSPAAESDSLDASPPPAEPVPGEADRSGFYSPVVRRIAEEHGVDLTRVQGSGVAGRVRKQDLLAYIRDAEQKPSNGASRPLHTESPYKGEPQAAPPPREETVDELVGPVRREAMSAIRRRTAEHMVASRNTAAHATTVVEVDFSALAKARALLAPQMAERGVKLTYLGFVALAAVEALGEHPVLNASVEGEELVFHSDANLGIAVATDEGLIVPVIRKAQRLSLEGIAAAIGDVAERARSGGLAPDDVYGGTFTITNPGQFGSVLATPIIHQPQVAILDLEAIVKRPVVVAGDALAVRPMANLCLSWDHRALDGVEAARFLAAVRERLERWEVLR